MVEIWEGVAKFAFDEGVDVIKFDAAEESNDTHNCTYYRKHLLALDAKACDFVAISSDTTYLIEVKDYGHPATSVPKDLDKVVAMKALHTLGAMVAIRESGGKFSDFASRALKQDEIRLVLSVGLPSKSGPLSNPKKFAADLQTSLRIKSRHVLPHANVHLLGSGGPKWSTSLHRNP